MIGFDHLIGHDRSIQSNPDLDCHRNLSTEIL